MFKTIHVKKISLFVLLILGLSFNLTAAQYSAQSMSVIVRGHDEQLKTISARVNLLQDNYAILVRSVNTLQKEVLTEKQRNIRLQNTIESLKQQIQKDRQQMNRNLNNVISKVSEETSRAINSVAKQQAAAQTTQSKRNSSAGGPIGTGDFAEYVVQPGATLSAIAKAYGVSVKNIKKTNGLHSDIIRVGQKIYIPQ